MEDFALTYFCFLPLIVGSYITILIMRFPDLTIEATWSISGIVSCWLLQKLIAYTDLSTSYFIVTGVGLLVGALCGVITSILFSFTGRVKLLSSLISYFIISAIGYHFLGNKAHIYLDHTISRFGLADKLSSAIVIYSIAALSILGILALWHKSSFGIKSRLLGENPAAYKFFKLSLDRTFASALIISNSIIGIAGALWATFNGQATNTQGVGLILNVFLALLIGDEVLKMIGFKRTLPLAAIIGTFIFVFAWQASIGLQINISLKGLIPGFRATDNTLLIALILGLILLIRRKSSERDKKVSVW